jgi:hypothetical protein
MKIGIIDAELVFGNNNMFRNNRFPNLACMKLSAYHKQMGDDVGLITTADFKPKEFDKIYLSAVFSNTAKNIPLPVLEVVEYGGTGFHYDKKAFDLATEIEHSFPDYHLYDTWVQSQLDKPSKKTIKAKQASVRYYTEYSVGFTTRGCPRGCDFCVNKYSKGSFRHSPVDEFLDKQRKKICLLDDNILACRDRLQILNELIETCEKNKMRFEFKQGVDVRLMSEECAKLFAQARYDHHFFFAFDDIRDAVAVERGISTFRKHLEKKQVKFYVLCGFYSNGVDDIRDTFERIRILWKYKCMAFIMQHENCKTSDPLYKGIYLQLARWCNQPQLQYKWTFRMFCNKSEGPASRLLKEFESLYPDIAERYFDMLYPK